jgi:3-oxoadipate enol-lactonase
MEENSDRMEEILKIVLTAPIPLHCFEAQLTAVMSWSDYSRLGDLKQPTLVLTGDEDILIKPENSRILADAIPDSRLVEFPGGGHGFFFQFPDQAAKVVLGFLG